ncbi:hypothetical protein HYPSUDRAFT_46801 [Hypholoma sublateritium FD-334 SS-4]|uniref:Uncharacterized protein n=1 Tax=Hypholoma sublateritium (strain FD-334 SS-4) TaxID=945553 RepID=A0A0D2NK85_HYPSF|nr:hypothetical protein HYPSUDRAFT_46801 [Hypholoma sublateritium FD-334 SS-4]
MGIARRTVALLDLHPPIPLSLDATDYRSHAARPSVPPQCQFAPVPAHPSLGATPIIRMPSSPP